MTKPVSYKRRRFPSQIIAHAVWLYVRFPLSLRLVEEMLLEWESLFRLRRSGDGERSSAPVTCPW